MLINNFYCYPQGHFYQTVAGKQYHQYFKSKILKDASIPFQVKPWEYEEMKNSDEKVNIGAFREVNKQYLGGRNRYSPVRE